MTLKSVNGEELIVVEISMIIKMEMEKRGCINRHEYIRIYKKIPPNGNGRRVI